MYLNVNYTSLEYVYYIATIESSAQTLLTATCQLTDSHTTLYRMPAVLVLSACSYHRLYPVLIPGITSRPPSPVPGLCSSAERASASFVPSSLARSLVVCLLFWFASCRRVMAKMIVAACRAFSLLSLLMFFLLQVQGRGDESELKTLATSVASSAAATVADISSGAAELSSSTSSSDRSFDPESDSCGPQIPIETPTCDFLGEGNGYELRKYPAGEVRAWFTFSTRTWFCACASSRLFLLIVVSPACVFVLLWRLCHLLCLAIIFAVTCREWGSLVCLVLWRVGSVAVLQIVRSLLLQYLVLLEDSSSLGLHLLVLGRLLWNTRNKLWRKI